MMLLKRLAARLPDRWQFELKRFYYGRQISKGTFETTEPEYKLLSQLVGPGDWVIDIGANVGHYTKRLSELVGARGRVIAFEPVPATFALLAANVQGFAHPNVTLVNAAVSDKLSVVGMSMPAFETGLKNYYQAHLSTLTDGALSVLSMSIDALGIRPSIALVKIDAEGHEAFVLAGMRQLLVAHRPVLIVETDSAGVIEDLSAMGYLPERWPDSPNILFRPGTLAPGGSATGSGTVTLAG